MEEDNNCKLVHSNSRASNKASAKSARSRKNTQNQIKTEALNEYTAGSSLITKKSSKSVRQVDKV